MPREKLSLANNSRNNSSTTGAFTHAVVWWAAHGKFSAQYGAVGIESCVDSRGFAELVDVPIYESVRFHYGKSVAAANGFEAFIITFCRDGRMATKLADALTTLSNRHKLTYDKVGDALPRTCTERMENLYEWAENQLTHYEAREFAASTQPNRQRGFLRQTSTPVVARSQRSGPLLPTASSSTFSLSPFNEVNDEARSTKRKRVSQILFDKSKRRRQEASSLSSPDSVVTPTASPSRQQSYTISNSQSAARVTVQPQSQQIDQLAKQVKQLRQRVETLEAQVGSGLFSGAHPNEVSLSRQCTEACFSSAPSAMPLGSPNWMKETYGDRATAIISMLRQLKISESHWPVIFNARHSPIIELPKRVLESRFTEQELAKFCMGKPMMTRAKDANGQFLRDPAGNLLPPMQTVLPDQLLMTNLIAMLTPPGATFDLHRLKTRFTSILTDAKRKVKARKTGASSETTHDE